MNESVAGGTTLHWLGPTGNAVDGVAGLTQDAVWVGGSHLPICSGTDRHVLVALTPGFHEQVLKWLLGAVVVAPTLDIPGM